MRKTDPVWKNLQEFANDHKLILEDHGEVGFGRSCVGFITRGGCYIEHNPTAWPDFLVVWPEDSRLYPPKNTPNAYHKHECLCVLAPDEDYDAALVELNYWVDHLKSQGTVRVESYDTGAQGIQAIINGLVRYAVRLEEKSE